MKHIVYLKSYGGLNKSFVVVLVVVCDIFGCKYSVYSCPAYLSFVNCLNSCRLVLFTLFA